MEDQPRSTRNFAQALRFRQAMCRFEDPAIDGSTHLEDVEMDLHAAAPSIRRRAFTRFVDRGGIIFTPLDQHASIQPPTVGQRRQTALFLVDLPRRHRADDDDDLYFDLLELPLPGDVIDVTPLSILPDEPALTLRVLDYEAIPRSYNDSIADGDVPPRQPAMSIISAQVVNVQIRRKDESVHLAVEARR